MHNLKNKIISLVLVAALSSGLFLSCAKEKPQSDTENDNAATTEGVSGENKIETTTELKDNVPELNFEETVINILEHDRSVNNEAFIDAEIYSEGETGELINDSVFRRNLKIEDRLNIKINSIKSKTLDSHASKSIKANDGSYDVINGLIYHLNSLFKTDLLIDMKTLPHVDFSQVWWDQNATKELSLANKQFMNVSSSNIVTIQATWVVLFNKKLIQENALENPYQLVRDKKWTIDKFYEMAKGVNPRDINGDGEMNGDDLWGYGNEYYNTGVMLIGSGEKLCKKDENDVPYISMNTQRAVDALDKIFNLVYDKGVTITAQDYSGSYKNPWYDMLHPAFETNRMLFYMLGMYNLPAFRDSDIDFGLLPIPKFDESQDRYYNTMTIWDTMLQAVPVTNEKLDATGAFLELLACESYKTIIPAYYKTSVENKFLRDEESVEMLDIIIKSRTFDLGFIYNWGGCLDLYSDLTQKASRDFVSAFEKKESAIQKAMDKDMERIKE